MEPVTHFLTGACLGRTGFNRRTALATLTMTLAAEAADIDVLWGIKGSIADLEHHRGITHSFVGVPFVAAFVLILVYGWAQVRKHFPSRRRKKPLASDNPDARLVSQQLPERWGYLYFLALIAALSHLLLDYTTAYGIRLFEPFNYRWYSWDIVFIVEPLMLVVLLAGLTLPSLFGLVNQEIGVRSKGPRGRGGAIFALVCVVVIWGVRDFQHRRALSSLDARTYDGAEPLRVAAYPYMVTPFRWYGVVETANFFKNVPVNSLGPEIGGESQGTTYYKPEETPASLAAKASYMGRVYLDWAVFPYLQVYRLRDGTLGYLAEFQDLRYAYPDLRGGRSPLTGYVVLSPDLNVLDEGMHTRNSPTVESLEEGQQPK